MRQFKHDNCTTPKTKLYLERSHEAAAPLIAGRLDKFLVHLSATAPLRQRSILGGSTKALSPQSLDHPWKWNNSCRSSYAQMVSSAALLLALALAFGCGSSSDGRLRGRLECLRAGERDVGV